VLFTIGGESSSSSFTPERKGVLLALHLAFEFDQKIQGIFGLVHLDSSLVEQSQAQEN